MTGSRVIQHSRDLRHSGGSHLQASWKLDTGPNPAGRTPMKTLLTAIAFVIAIVFTSQAFAADLPDCPKTMWKNGNYVCGDLDTNS
jgi:hypothetical protein